MLEIAGTRLAPRLIVFDKDGTLIAFAPLWRAWFERMMTLLAEQVHFDAELHRACATTLGYELKSQEWDPVGPLTIASTGELAVLFAGLLYRYRGLPWVEAIQLVQDTERATREGLPVEELVQPIGDVRGLLERLADQGIRLAIATTDDRDLTLKSLDKLGISHLVEAVICGDDGVPLKPAPDMALAICDRLMVPPQEAIMVGDTVADLEMAQAAGFLGAVAVSSGAVPAAMLATHTPLVIDDIHGIHILSEEEAWALSMQPSPRYRGYIFDLDGTIYRGEELIPGARERVLALRAAGCGVVFLSNKPLESRASYAAKLTRLGIPTPIENVINSTQALMHYLRTESPDSRLFVIGEPGLRQEFVDAGFALTERVEEIEIVVAAFDRTLTYEKLNMAHQALARGARFLATNPDRTCPVAGGEVPDCAGVIAFLEATSERHVELVAGKPSPQILEAAVSRTGAALEDCLMVGDRLATDMVMGITTGMDTALVLTGVTTEVMLAQSDIRPTYVLASVAQVP